MKNKNSEKMKAAEIISLSGFINYQSGSIVSKTLIDKKSGSTTLFSFDKGQKLSEHTAPFDALVLIVDGEAEIKISGTPNRLKSGEAILMPAGKPHAVNAVESFKMVLIMIKSE